jgi:peptide/nickel transport system permease protein
VLLLALGVLAAAAPWLAGAPAIDLDRVLEAPSSAHPMGTDGLGRDLVSRVLYGGRVSLTVGLLAALLALGVGLPLGAAAGYRGGATDVLVSRLIETVLCFPGLVLALALLGAAPAWISGLPDVLKIALVLGISGWIPVARYLRAEFRRLGRSEMVLAARSSGAGHLRLALRHILPAALAPVLVTAAFTVAAAITAEAALSFLGLGVRPPTPTWGGLLYEAKSHVDRAWWLVLFPGTALFLAVLGCNLVGEGLRDWLDPRGAPR